MDFISLILNGAGFIIVGFIIYLQSLQLYQSVGFSNPFLTSIGAIIMVLGFAALHSIKKSWFALFLCIYAGGYESYFMISATIQNEQILAQEEVLKDPEYNYLNEKANLAKEKYLSYKSRFDDRNSKVYRNRWYQRNYLKPAWKESELATKEFLKRNKDLKKSNYKNSIVGLKIIYRLGLVLLSMVLVHRFMKSIFYKE